MELGTTNICHRKRKWKTEISRRRIWPDSGLVLAQNRPSLEASVRSHQGRLPLPIVF